MNYVSSNIAIWLQGPMYTYTIDSDDYLDVWGLIAEFSPVDFHNMKQLYVHLYISSVH